MSHKKAITQVEYLVRAEMAARMAHNDGKRKHEQVTTKPKKLRRRARLALSRMREDARRHDDVPSRP